MRLIYLAAPLSSPDRAVRCDQMHAAQQLRDALESDPCTMVYLPHERIARRHGYPNEDECPAVRLEAMEMCLATLRKINARGGELHVLTRADGSISRGCQAEIEHWEEIGGGMVTIWRPTATGWVSADGRQGMSRT